MTPHVNSTLYVPCTYFRSSKHPSPTTQASTNSLKEMLLLANAYLRTNKKKIRWAMRISHNDFVNFAIIVEVNKFRTYFETQKTPLAAGKFRFFSTDSWEQRVNSCGMIIKIKTYYKFTVLHPLVLYFSSSILKTSLQNK